MVYYIIYSFAKAFDYFNPGFSIIPLKKPHSWINPTFCASAPMLLDTAAGNPAKQVVLPQSHGHRPEHHYCSLGLLCLPGQLLVI